MTYFAKINDPKKVRIALLEASRETLILLRQQKLFLQNKDQKTKLIDSLKKDLKDITDMARRFEELLPNKEIRQEILDERARLKAEIKELQKSTNEKIKRKQSDDARQLKVLDAAAKVSKSRKKVVSQPKVEEKPPVSASEAVSDLGVSPVTDLDRLEYTLSKIESKINELKE